MKFSLSLSLQRLVPPASSWPRVAGVAGATEILLVLKLLDEPLDLRCCPGPGVRCAHTGIADCFSPCRSDLHSLLGSPHELCKVAENVENLHGVAFAALEQGRHLCLPCHRRVCRLCHTGALGERHMLLECTSLADLWNEISLLVAHCSGVMARLVWPIAYGQQVHCCIYS